MYICHDIYRRGVCWVLLTLRVDIERLLACNGMCSHNGVGVGYGLTALDAALSDTGIDLLDARVNGLQTVQPLLEGGRQAVVGLDGIGEKSVATNLGDVEDVQEGSTGRLLLVGDV